VSFGRALAEANVSELRFLRLLEARGPQLADTLRTVVHHLVSRAQRFRIEDVAALVLFGDREGADAGRRIARDFYRHSAD
jgi:hypothetical protein